MQRYRECHGPSSPPLRIPKLTTNADFYHLISGPFPVSMAPEVVVKLFEFANMGLPVALLSSLFGPLRLASDERKALFDAYLAWALRAGSAAKPLINVEWEKNWTTDIDKLRDDIGIVKPPVEWRQWRRDLRAKRATT